MIEENKVLESAGLTKGESRVYLSLLRLGESTVGPIAKKAMISLSKIYETLDKLIEKGLVGSVIKNNVKYFTASNPERILDYLELKKKGIESSEIQIKKMISYLRASIPKTETKALIYEGFKSIKNFYEEILNLSKKGDIIYALGIPKFAAEEYEGYFLDWNKRRAKKSVEVKAIYNFDAKEAGKKRAKIPFTDVRYLTEKMVTPAWILIFEDFVATVHMAEKPICFVLQDKVVAFSYVDYFNLLWKISKS